MGSIGLFSGAKNTHITNANVNVNTPTYIGGTRSTVRGLELLRQRSVLGALWDSSDRYELKPCDPATRVFTKSKIMEWILNDELEASVMWLYGTIGTGKTALARSIAEICNNNNTLFATFAFSRTIPITDGDQLIPTLAYQLLSRMVWPRLLTSLDLYRHPHPDLFEKGRDVQMRELVIDPLNSYFTMVEFGLRSLIEEHEPRLVVIDGLDECSNPDLQRDLLRHIATAVSETHLRIKILICSRPEQDLRAVFEDEEFFSSNNLTTVDLEADPHTADDIKLFLQARFATLSKYHPLKGTLVPQWPSEAEYSRIVEMASGQFIYAAVVADFVCSSLHDPVERLESLLDRSRILVDENLYSRLDSLYQHIFTTHARDQVGRVNNSVLNIIGSVLIEAPTSSCRDLYETPAGIAEAIGISPRDVILRVSPLICLLRVHTPKGDLGMDTKISIRHASMMEFLRNKKRSGDFFIDEPHIHEIFLGYHKSSVQGCIQECTFRDVQTEACSHRGLIDRHLVPFIIHIRQASTPTARDELDAMFRSLLDQNRSQVPPQCRRTLVRELSVSLQTNQLYPELDYLYSIILADSHASTNTKTVLDTIGLLIASDPVRAPLTLHGIQDLLRVPIDKLEGIIESNLACGLISENLRRERDGGSTTCMFVDNGFTDFLCDRDRSKEFFIDKRQKHWVLARYYEPMLLEKIAPRLLNWNEQWRDDTLMPSSSTEDQSRRHDSRLSKVSVMGTLQFTLTHLIDRFLSKRSRDDVVNSVCPGLPITTELLRTTLAPFIFHQSNSPAYEHHLVLNLMRLFKMHRKCNSQCNVSIYASEIFRAFPSTITHGGSTECLICGKVKTQFERWGL